jgi:hypothetical protein
VVVTAGDRQHGGNKRSGSGRCRKKSAHHSSFVRYRERATLNWKRFDETIRSPRCY